MGVEQHTVGFENLMIKVDLIEFEKSTIAKYFGSLKYENLWCGNFATFLVSYGYDEACFEGGKTVPKKKRIVLIGLA